MFLNKFLRSTPGVNLTNSFQSKLIYSFCKLDQSVITNENVCISETVQLTKKNEWKKHSFLFKGVFTQAMWGWRFCWAMWFQFLGDRKFSIEIALLGEIPGPHRLCKRTLRFVLAVNFPNYYPVNLCNLFW